MKKVLFILTLNSSNIFYVILSLIGLEYYGAGESLGYIIFCALLATLSLLCFSLDLFVLKRFSLNPISILFLILPGIISLFYFAEKPLSGDANKNYTLYLLFSLTATYIGIYVARRNWFAFMVK
jgi:hypothetical protein